jgi:AraC-like DNA-binding protein
VIPGDFDFRQMRTTPPLDALVPAIWYARGVAPHRRERILPSPGAVLLVVLGAPLRMTAPGEEATPRELEGEWLTGPHDRPIINEPTGETFVVGASFDTAGIHAFVETPVDRLTNAIVPLRSAAHRPEPEGVLSDRLRHLADPDAMMAELGGWLSERVVPPSDHARWVHAMSMLTDPECPSIAAIQESCGVSRRHFGAEIRRRSGLLPKTLQRIARMRRLIEELDARRPIRWSREAVGAGYFDQPHAIRDFRRFTGLTPTEYVERRRAAWGHAIAPGEAPQFVPEIIR